MSGKRISYEVSDGVVSLGFEQGSGRIAVWTDEIIQVVRPLEGSTAVLGGRDVPLKSGGAGAPPDEAGDRHAGGGRVCGDGGRRGAYHPHGVADRKGV